MNFSTLTQKVLTDAGWFPNRSTDISIIENQLARAGVKSFDSARNFLSEFGNLILHPPIDPPPQVDFRGHIYFQPEFVSFDDRERQALETLAEEPVYPIGYTGVCLNLFITPRGRFVCSDIDYLAFAVLGETKEEALEVMCDGRYCRVGGVRLDAELKPAGTFPPFSRAPAASAGETDADRERLH